MTATLGGLRSSRDIADQTARQRSGARGHHRADHGRGSVPRAIRLTDIPPGLAANASRRALTRFERAEIGALLTAPADCNNNKTEAAKLAGV